LQRSRLGRPVRKIAPALAAPHGYLEQLKHQCHLSLSEARAYTGMLDASRAKPLDGFFPPKLRLNVREMSRRQRRAVPGRWILSGSGGIYISSIIWDASISASASSRPSLRVSVVDIVQTGPTPSRKMCSRSASTRMATPSISSATAREYPLSPGTLQGAVEISPPWLGPS
jgi:hypothetical protein